MRKIEIPKDELYQKYIVENLTRYEVASFFNVNEKCVTRRLREYNIFKNHDSIQKNRERTSLKKYGAKSPYGSKEIREKCRQTMVKRYGVSYTAQSKELRDKMSNTMHEKYNKDFYVETDTMKKYLKNLSQERYGTNAMCQNPKCIKALEKAVGHSQPEQNFAKILKTYNIKYEQEFPLRGFKYDFKVGNLLFEINPSSTHNSTFGLFGRNPKNKMYHYTKYSVAKEFGYHCIHVFDWDDPVKIVQVFLEQKQRIYARKCEIKSVSVKEATDFLNQNHLQGYAKDEIRLGLYDKTNDELVEIMTFAKPRYNKNYEYELIRLCSNKNVVGGTEKLFNYFVEQYKPKSIISYCDLSKFDGKIYEKLGFKVLNKPQPSKHWINLKTNQHITDNLLRQKGFDQLFKTHYGKGTSNEELMVANSFVEVYDCGQLTFIKKYL